MNYSSISDQQFGNITLRFPHDPDTGRVGLQLFPSALADDLVPRRSGLGGLPYISSGNPPAQIIDSLVQIKLVGDSFSGRFAQGHTMRDSGSIDVFKFTGQKVEESDGIKVITTTLLSGTGLRIEHSLLGRQSESAFEASSRFYNDSDRSVTLEMLSSFSLGDITPFHAADAPGRLKVHRFRAGWSSEGRLDSQSIEQLDLEPSWVGAAAFSERFGQVGTMPVRKWFPFVAVEDTEAGVVWGAQLAWAGSWQMEVFRQHDDVCLSGGLADREFGHWMKTLAPGESLSTPTAVLTCVHGSLDDLCDNLTAQQNRAADTHPAVEEDLPIMFNEWCTTWGDPQHDKLLAIADRLADSEVSYLVIDAGWYKGEESDWGLGMGDWVPNTKLFPNGLKATADAIRERGLIPGLWYEMEIVGALSKAIKTHTASLLERDGQPIIVGDRRFWDLNDPCAIDYLTERVIGLLGECGFGYLKVDYNETLGLGCDHPDGLGEGLRQQVFGIYQLFEKIRTCLPDLVIENCASGGHRLEPSMLALTSMSSFSDAHEVVEIPIIAASLHRLILPRQSQIWCVLRKTDSEQRLIYSLAATFLGRMCLSGEITELTESQWALVLEAQRLYRHKAAPIIKYGTSRHFGERGESWRYPQGWQGVLRTSQDGASALLVLHAFDDAPEHVSVPIEGGMCQVEGLLASGEVTCGSNRLNWKPEGNFSACVVVLSS